MRMRGREGLRDGEGGGEEWGRSGGVARGVARECREIGVGSTHLLLPTTLDLRRVLQEWEGGA